MDSKLYMEPNLRRDSMLCMEPDVQRLHKEMGQLYQQMGGLGMYDTMDDVVMLCQVGYCKFAMISLENGNRHSNSGSSIYKEVMEGFTLIPNVQLKMVTKGDNNG